MNQSRLDSAIEAVVNIVIGFSINFVANMIVFPAFGYPLSLSDNWWIGCIYTGISLVRQFVLRRFFNGKRVAHAIGKLVTGA